MTVNVWQSLWRRGGRSVLCSQSLWGGGCHSLLFWGRELLAQRLSPRLHISLLLHRNEGRRSPNGPSSLPSKLRASFYPRPAPPLTARSLLSDPPSLSSDDFVLQWKAECHFGPGGEGMRFLQRHFYNGEEFVYFDSAVGRFIAKTELGRPSAEYWNNNTEYLEDRRAAVETFCKHNYGVDKPYTEERRVPPNVKITPSRAPSLDHQNLLVCFVSGFFPSEIQVKWLRNGVEDTDVVSSELTQNGDWTYQIHVILETVLEHGDTYTCEVEHSSLQEPLRMHWKPETSESARSKQLTGIVGFVLGAVFTLVGLIVYLKNKKGPTQLQIPQNDGLLS
ncbi:H-2 class II histocompatibility antigen, E-S beta chain-like [Rhinatrema bivittatum]|uniref:H-2 class II histocompatibility antigen, E-S beta chain-like n=1 Tax=Rhinatrema bivittatum TaxID=194408 RepID=UPI00112AE443|nr:H-2 class II histocompatibility antigen, E-S beta chain-like [Rhinatrema bivittatum]